jgi:hypothetical protein
MVVKEDRLSELRDAVAAVGHAPLTADCRWTFTRIAPSMAGIGCGKGVAARAIGGPATPEGLTLRRSTSGRCQSMNR